MRNSDALRRLFMLMTAAILCAMETAVVIYIMNRYYNYEFRTMLYLRGHILMAGIYLVVLIFLGRVFGGLMVGVRKNGEVLFSHFFTTLFANLSFYVLLMLLSLKFPNPMALIAGALVQLVVSFIIIGFMGSRYRKIFRPYDVLLIYGSESVEEFRPKLDTRKDQFEVSDMVSADDEPEAVRAAIDRTSTVMLVDIEAAKRNKIFKYCYENSKRIYVMPKLSDIILNGAAPIHLFDTPLLLTEGNPLEYEERVIKRAWDILFSLFLIIVLSPVMLVTAICIKLQDGGPVLYRQTRCTKNGRRFEILKFRSMVVDAEKAGKAVLATENDPRITKVGRVIRKCRIDELPQLFNVLKGDMSFVGPRPERPEFIEKYAEEMPEFSYRMKVRAGITGYAQLYGKYNTKPYDKLKFDLYYIEQFSIGLDIRLMILTFKILFTKESTEGTSERIEA
ncbi:MAG TPA: exopolysaccharide biosynthesis polyprenyl glycosylphosphotransferase [Lachnospiraceae bacterium]|nr:exopolysaccharide biosynthesis polyprenyl glycosylphosphotransferase [Lachnospiraceae bacterium]